MIYSTNFQWWVIDFQMPVNRTAQFGECVCLLILNATSNRGNCRCNISTSAEARILCRQ